MFQYFINTLRAFFKILVTNFNLAFNVNAMFYSFVISTLIFFLITNFSSNLNFVSNNFTHISLNREDSKNSQKPIDSNKSQGDSSNDLFHIFDIEEIFALLHTKDFFEHNELKLILISSIKYHYIESNRLQIYLDISSPPPQI